MKVTEYKSGVLQQTDQMNSSNYAGATSGEKIENVSNILGRKSSGEDYSEFTGNNEEVSQNKWLWSDYIYNTELQ